jgi:hypothetical protein
LVFEVQLARDRVHDLVGDLAVVAQPHELSALGVEQVAQRPL